MATLALDIETASPFDTPGYGDFEDTDYFELVAVALGHRPGPDAPVETTVHFRTGDWSDAATAELVRRAGEWATERGFDRTLTYNGSGFDAVHLREWASRLADAHPDLPATVDDLFADHRDLAPVAGHRFSDREFDGRFPRFERACAWCGVEVPETRYADFAVDPELVERVEGETVAGRHVGEVLGAAYVEGDRPALERLLTRYAETDVEPLFALADELGVDR